MEYSVVIEKFLQRTLFYILIVTPLVAVVGVIVVGPAFFLNNLILICTALFVVMSIVSAISLKGADFNHAHLVAYSGVVAVYYGVTFCLHWWFFTDIASRIVPVIIFGMLLLINFSIIVLESWISIRDKSIDSLSRLPWGRAGFTLLLVCPIMLNLIYGHNSPEDVYGLNSSLLGLVATILFACWVFGAMSYKILHKQKSVEDRIFDRWFVNNAASM